MLLCLPFLGLPDVGLLAILLCWLVLVLHTHSGDHAAKLGSQTKYIYLPHAARKVTVEASPYGLVQADGVSQIRISTEVNQAQPLFTEWTCGVACC